MFRFEPENKNPDILRNSQGVPYEFCNIQNFEKNHRGYHMILKKFDNSKKTQGVAYKFYQILIFLIVFSKFSEFFWQKFRGGIQRQTGGCLENTTKIQQFEKFDCSQEKNFIFSKSNTIEIPMNACVDECVASIETTHASTHAWPCVVPVSE